MDYNRSSFVGRLTRDPEYFPAGARGEAHCTFTLAVNRVVSNQDGPGVDYIPCSLWGPRAQVLKKLMGRGDELGISGRLRVNRVQEANDSFRLFFEIRVEEIHEGCKPLRKLGPQPTSTPVTQAVGSLMREFHG